MSWSRKRRYALRWKKYQRRCDTLTYGREGWFMGKEFMGTSAAYWKVRRHQLINWGVPSGQLTPWKKGNR